jgi:hypothetical protein
VQDVSEMYADIQSRLENKRRVEKRFHELINKAASVTDLIRLEESLGNIRGDIESTEKKLALISEKINYSTLVVQLYKRDETIKNLSEQNFIGRMKFSLWRGWSGLYNTIFFLISAWPIFIVLVVLILLMKKSLKSIKLSFIKKTT